jgi:hypothetical protein
LEILQRKTSGPPDWLASSKRFLNSVFRQHRRALVALLTVLAYADTLRFRFVYDDYPQILVNPRLTSWHYLPQYFTSDVWSHYFANAAIHYYRPIFLIWLFINYALFQLHPLGWHAMNVILHLTVTVLVWNFVERMTSDREVACFASLISGLHPIHTEVVAWVSTSSEMLLRKNSGCDPRVRGRTFTDAAGCQTRAAHQGTAAQISVALSFHCPRIPAIISSQISFRRKLGCLLSCKLMRVRLTLLRVGAGSG